LGVLKSGWPNCFPAGVLLSPLVFCIVICRESSGCGVVEKGDIALFYLLVIV
jgi:hypothetical protein